MKRIKRDLTGLIFGRLTVMNRVEDYVSSNGNHTAMWACKCECGTIKNISHTHLLSGATQSCGCLQRERASKQSFKNLVGEKFGRLTVLALSENRTKSRGRKWICQCECGTIKEVAQLALLNGSTVSCGCYNRDQLQRRNLIDLTGNTFGRWTVIERTECPSHIANITGSWWLCECGCEAHTKKVVRGSSLTSGKSESCGCLHKEKVSALHFTDLTGSIFGNLTVLQQAEAPETNKNKSATYWLCRCNCGNEVVVIAANLNNGHTTSCGCVNSKGEKKIIQILNENNISFVHDRGVFKDCKLSTGGTARFDFYVNGSYVIEYDGEIHYEGCNSGWYTQNRLEQTLQRDREKNEYCWSHNIPIIRIPYWERDNLTLEDLRLETTSFLCTPENINQNN